MACETPAHAPPTPRLLIRSEELAIDVPEPELPAPTRRSAANVARAVERGRGIAEALRFLHAQGDDPEAPRVAAVLARFLVARCEARHAGWRTLRGVVIAAGAQPPWERCARRAAGQVAADLLALGDGEAGRPTLAVAQHLAARRRAEQLAPHVASAAVLAELKLAPRPVDDDAWAAALREAVTARSREQVARRLDDALA